MKNVPSRKPYQLRLSESELLHLISAVAETLEEKRHPYGRADLARLVGLHNRLRLIWGETVPDYALKDGAVVLAQRPDVVIVSAPRQRQVHATSSHQSALEAVHA